MALSGISPNHQAILAHHPYTTLGSVEKKREKAEERERKEKEAEDKKKSQIQVVEFWRPFGLTVGLFVTAGKRCTANIFSVYQVH